MEKINAPIVMSEAQARECKALMEQGAKFLHKAFELAGSPIFLVLDDEQVPTFICLGKVADFKGSMEVLAVASKLVLDCYQENTRRVQPENFNDHLRRIVQEEGGGEDVN